MKIRVAVNEDLRYSYLFNNIDKVIDGVRSAKIIQEKIEGKLVLISKDKTVAVFNRWLFWEEIPDKEKCEAIPIMPLKNTGQETEKLIKKLDNNELLFFKELLEKVEAETSTNNGLHSYGLWLYVNEEIKRRDNIDKHEPDKDAKY